MLKANELRIGNYVHHNVENSVTNFINDYLTVCGLEEDSVTTFYKNLKGVNQKVFNRINYKPIPITEEWLIKFGFKAHDYICPENHLHIKNNEFTKKIDKYNNIVIQSDFSYGIEDIEKDNILCFENDIIKHVHQLQNLYFSITGEELKIK